MASAERFFWHEEQKISSLTRTQKASRRKRRAKFRKRLLAAHWVLQDLIKNWIILLSRTRRAPDRFSVCGQQEKDLASPTSITSPL